MDRAISRALNLGYSTDSLIANADVKPTMQLIMALIMEGWLSFL